MRRRVPRSTGLAGAAVAFAIDGDRAADRSTFARARCRRLPRRAAPGAPVPVPDAPHRTQVVLKVGDTLRVEGAPIGCQVTRRAGAAVIECRRDGALAGTYGTFIERPRTVTVARFRSSRTAQAIFTAKHGGALARLRAHGTRGPRAAVERGCR